MGFWAGAIIVGKVVAVSVGTVVVIGAVAYGIYKVDQYWRETSHEHGKGGPPPPDAGGSNNVTFEDIKSKTVDTELRRRKVTKEDVQNKVNEDKSIGNEDASDEPQKKIEQCHIEVKTISMQGTQTEIFNLQVLPLPANGNLLLNNDAISVSSSTTFDEINSTCDSLASTETVTSSIDLDLDFLSASIPTWSEMSDRDRELCLCPACEKPVSTVTIPCEHPYLCDECAPVLKKNYSKCRLCQKVISGFRNI